MRWIAVLIAVSLFGCTMHQTPDGHELWSGSGQESVRAELGQPDLITERIRYGFGGSNLLTVFFYLERGYRVSFLDNRVRGVRSLSEVERRDLGPKARAYQEDLHKVKVGDGQAEVLASIGPPRQVSTGRLTAEGEVFQDSSGPYRGQLEASPPLEWVRCTWWPRNLVLDFRNGVVVRMGTVSERLLENELGETSPD